MLARTVLVVSAFPVPSEKLYDAAYADTSTQGPDHNHSDCQTATPQTTQTRQTRQTFRAEGGGALPRLYATLEAMALPPTVMLAALTSGARLNRRILEDVADCTSAQKPTAAFRQSQQLDRVKHLKIARGQRRLRPK